MLLYHFILIPLLIHLICFIKQSKAVAFESTSEFCDKTANCVSLNSTKCLDITLSYKYSKLNGLLHDFNLINELEIHEFLSRWTGLKSVPRCWASIQPLLCTAFFPRCDEEKVSLPSLQLCKNVKTNCKILDQFISSNNIKTIPSFLNCNDTDLYHAKCKNELTDIKFNSSAAHCQYPLVATDDSNVYYKNIEGCALDCDDPLYERVDKIAFQKFIIWLGFISLAVVLISVVSYLPKWSALTLTSKITFYIQLCFLIHYYGWLMQAFMDKKQIVCRPDQTLKYSEPNKNSGLACLINFILIYYSAFSILTWYVIMAITLKFSNKKFKSNLFENSILYFHLVAWCTSFFFTIMAIAFSQIDGNYVYGICFVGFSKRISRFVFVLLPLTVGASIFIYGMLHQAIPIRSMIHQSSKLKENLMKRNEYKKTYKKLVISSFSMFFVLVFSYIVHTNKNDDLTEWLDSLNNEVMCQLNLNSAFGLKNSCNSNCNKNLKKSLTLDYWVVVFVFGCGIFSSFWNFDFITIILWLFEFKEKIDKTVRPDKIEQKNAYLEKLLHNKKDPVKMNLSTMTTNPVSNNQNNRDLTNDSKASNAHKLYRQKILEKKQAKESKKNQKLGEDTNVQLEMNNMPQSQFNHLNMFHDQKIFIQALNNEFSMSNGLQNFANLPNGVDDTVPKWLENNCSLPAFLNNLPENQSLPINQTSMNAPNYENNMMKLNELRKKEYESLGFSIIHGMTQHSNKLMNPFEEKRRPDSKLERAEPKKTNELNENLKMTSGNMALKDSLLNQNLNNFHLPLPLNQFPPSQMFCPGNLVSSSATNFQANFPQHFNSFLQPFYPPGNNFPMMNPLSNQLNFPQLLQEQQYHQLLQNKIKQQAQRNFKHLLDQQYANGQFLINSKNINDLEAKKREIGETIHITQTVGSASDSNDRKPVQIHDSDISSMCSDDTCYSKNGNKNYTETIQTDFKEVHDKLRQVSDSEDTKEVEEV